MDRCLMAGNLIVEVFVQLIACPKLLCNTFITSVKCLDGLRDQSFLVVGPSSSFVREFTFDDPTRVFQQSVRFCATPVHLKLLLRRGFDLELLVRTVELHVRNMLADEEHDRIVVSRMPSVAPMFCVFRHFLLRVYELQHEENG